MRPMQRLGAVVILCAAALTAAGCRAIDSHEELQTLAGDVPQETPAETTGAASTTAAGDEGLDRFPLVGSVFPGLGGRLHSSLCDPTADALGRCL